MASPLTQKPLVEPAVRQEELLSAYERLQLCSERMLAYARDANWEALIAVQGDYLAEVETLHRVEDKQMGLDRDAEERKAELLEKILEQDKEIRQRLIDRRQELAQLILGSRQQLTLSRTYSYYQGTSEVVEAAQRFNST